MRLTKKGYHPNLPPEKKKEYNEKQRIKYNAATPEQKRLRAEKRKAYEKKVFDNMSAEEKELFKLKRRIRWQKFHNNMSEEQASLRYEKTLVRNMKNYNKLTPEEKAKRLQYYKDNDKRRREERRLLVISHYTHGTMRCMNPNCEVPGGAKNILALQADHIGGGGRNHAKETGNHMYEWIIKNNFPSGFQILCANCNTIKKIIEKEDYKRGISFGTKSV